LLCACVINPDSLVIHIEALRDRNPFVAWDRPLVSHVSGETGDRRNIILIFCQTTVEIMRQYVPPVTKTAQGGKGCQEPFLGRQGLRRVDCNANSAPVWATHFSDPYGLPRGRAYRIFSISSLPWDSFSPCT